MLVRSCLLSFLVVIVAGCRWGVPPDPNDPAKAGLLTPEVLRRNLSGASDALLERVHRREISDAQFKDLMAKAANNLLDQVDVERVPPNQAWEYGEIYVTARRWKDAKKALEVAIKSPKNEDRRVNDHLRLARVLAEMGDVHGAVETAKKILDTQDTGAAPILPATLLEIVPAGQGKGADAELAGLLEEAIKCEMRTIVDPNALPGQAFLAARPFHVRHAWSKVVELLNSAGKPDEAKAAQARAQAMLQQQAGV